MLQSPPETLIPKSNQPWTLITRKKRRNRPNPPPPPPHPQTLTLTLTPSPFTPTGFSDPRRESKLLLQIQSAVAQLSNSPFLRHFLSLLHSPQIHHPLHNLLLSSSPQIQFVAFGIGSIESYKSPRLQLALALLLKRELGANSPNPIEVFDPVLSVVECNVLASLGLRIIEVNECGRRVAAGPTIFYMPHCEASLYDNLLGANWAAERLRRMAVVGNSFGVYEGLGRGAGGGGFGRHLVGARRFVKEVAFCEEEDGEFYLAFHDMSWHFFEVHDDDDQLGFLL